MVFYQWLMKTGVRGLIAGRREQLEHFLMRSDARAEVESQCARELADMVHFCKFWRL